MGKDILKKIIAVAGFFLVLQLLYVAHIRIVFLPSPFEVLTTFWSLLIHGTIFPDIWASVTRVLVGFGLAAVAGTLLGLLLAWRPAAGEYSTPILELLRPIPPIAWVPLAILLFG